jgi:hypothetical protein
LQMAVPLLTQKIVKKRVKQFKRPHLDRYKCLKVGKASPVALIEPCCAEPLFCVLLVDVVAVCYIAFDLGSPGRMVTCEPI